MHLVRSTSRSTSVATARLRIVWSYILDEDIPIEAPLSTGSAADTGFNI